MSACIKNAIIVRHERAKMKKYVFLSLNMCLMSQICAMRDGHIKKSSCVTCVDVSKGLAKAAIGIPLAGLGSVATTVSIMSATTAVIFLSKDYETMCRGEVLKGIGNLMCLPFMPVVGACGAIVSAKGLQLARSGYHDIKNALYPAPALHQASSSPAWQQRRYVRREVTP